MCAKILYLLTTLSAAAAVQDLTTFCDTKRALNASATAPLVPDLLPTLVSSLHCSGLRVPLLPTLRSPAEYSAAYNATLAWAARAQLVIYASPMEGAWRAVAATGSEPAYAAWVAAYAAAFRPSHLSVFNEVSDADCDGGCKERVVVAVRRALAPPLPLFVGPDSEHVSAPWPPWRAAPTTLLCLTSSALTMRAGTRATRPGFGRSWWR